jgi:hypothetical protein
MKDGYYYRSLLLTLTVYFSFLGGLMALTLISGAIVLVILTGIGVFLLTYFYGGFRKFGLRGLLGIL